MGSIKDNLLLLNVDNLLLLLLHFSQITGQIQSVINTFTRPSITSNNYITFYYINFVIDILIIIQFYKFGTSWITPGYNMKLEKTL